MSDYLSLPQSSAGAGVLVLHAWRGLNDTFRRFCDRLVGEGFVVLVAHPAANRLVVGVVGFSLGGYYALGLACQKPKSIAAVVTLYGTGRGKFGDAQAAFLGHFAEDDEFESVTDVL